MTTPPELSERGPKSRRGGTSAWITLVMAASAMVYLGFRLLLGLSEEDTDLYESPLMLSVARQLVMGPGELYGPFGAGNPLVLIHAPLYYRIAGLAAWPLAMAGLHPVTAARLAGRFLSVLGLLATLVAAYRLARLGGGSPRAGWWAVLLIAAAPVLAGVPVAVRPDMAGVALQTWGVVLLLEGLEQPGRRLAWAFATFGLALCVKQHLVAAVASSTVLLLLAWRRRQVPLGTIVRGLLAGLGPLAVVYGLEWLVTAGRIEQAAFEAAGSVGRAHPGDWLHVGTVLAAVVGKGAGLAGLLAAIWAGSAPGRRSRVTAGLLVAAIAAFSLLQLATARPWIAGPLVALATTALVLAVPNGMARSRRSGARGRFDSILWAYCAAELAIVVLLSKASSGAWINYAIPAVVLTAVLTARGLALMFEERPSLRRSLPVATAVLAVLGSALMDMKETASRRLDERAALAQVFVRAQLPPSAFFFADRPGLNRAHGRLDLVYDDWLYPVFELLRLAEPRSRWVRPFLTNGGPVRVVALLSKQARVAGVPESLPELGFHAAGTFGPFQVWARGAPEPHAAAR